MKDSDSYHLVLASHRWATLTWPLLCSHERVNLFSLDSEGGCSWQYVHRPDDWLGVPFYTVWKEDVGVILQQQGSEKPLVMNSLRSSSGFSQGDLLSIFDLLGIEASMRPKKTTCRRDVLEKLCELVAPGDLVFKDLVMEQDVKSKQKIAKNEEFYSAIFEQLDESEKSEFKDLLKDMNKEKKAEVQKKWNGMLKDKIAERKVT